MRSVYRYVTSGGSFGGSPLRQTIGLGAADSIQAVEVDWPRSDTRQRFTDVALDEAFRVQEGSSALAPLDLERLVLGGQRD